MRDKEQEQEFVERCEKDALEDLLYLMRNGQEQAVNRILDALREEAVVQSRALDIVARELREMRDQLLADLEVR